MKGEVEGGGGQRDLFASFASGNLSHYQGEER